MLIKIEIINMERRAPTAPPFGRLLLAALRSVGIDGVSLDLLRRAKKNAVDARECSVLWRLLHDLVLVVLLDFEVDADAMRDAAHEMGSAGIVEELPVWQELVRHYLYEWGFVCRAFYAPQSDTPASVLLLAVAWLLAHARFFERQHEAILAIYIQATATAVAPMPRLPPYPNDVALPPSAVADAVASVVASSQGLAERIHGDFDVTARLHQLQVLLGRIQAHHRALQSAREEFGRMLGRLEDQQRAAGAARDDELIPAYALQVFADGKSQLERHVVVLTERLQMIEDEKLFYKWINGVVLQYAPLTSDKEDPVAVLESQYVALYADILHAKTALEQTAEMYQHVANIYVVEKKKWQQKAKTRTQQAKMEEKMEKLRHEIATKELLDTTTLFLDRKGDSVVLKDTFQEKTRVQFVEDSDLERLQNQLERVMREITTQYCHVELI